MTPEQEQLAAKILRQRRAAQISTVLDASGALLVIAGVALWSIPVALIVAGLAVLLIAHPIPTKGSR